MTLPRKHWADMTWPDFRAANVTDWIAVLPIAATEQHGPHLPLSTDTDIMRGYLDLILAALPGDLPATFLPVQTIGLSPEHRDFPGSLSLSPEAALRTWTDLGADIARTGIRKLVFVSSHGGNNALLDVVARELRLRHHMLAVTASFARFGYPDGLFSADEVAHGIHGGDVETSLMLAFRPDLVRQDKIADFPAETVRMEHDFDLLRATRPAAFGWLAQDLNPDGAIGDASRASAEKGKSASAFGTERFIALLQDVTAFPLERLRAGPLG